MTTAVAAEERSRGAWWRILLIGLALFVIGVLVFALTGNLNLFPTVALIGNFLVPVGYVAFFYERRSMSRVTLVSIARAFFFGGVLGVFAAALLEPVFIRRLTFESAFGVGVIEEFAKILGVIVVARHHRQQRCSNARQFLPPAKWRSAESRKFRYRCSRAQPKPGSAHVRGKMRNVRSFG